MTLIVIDNNLHTLDGPGWVINGEAAWPMSKISGDETDMI